ncbi:MAG: hypothetical protein AABX55_00580 [Nanoarchaeota archaeon]
MNKNNLLNWIKRYEEMDNDFSSKCEKEVGLRIRSNKFLTKNDLKKIVKWKFQSLPGRKKLFLSYANKLDENELKKVSSMAFKEKDELKKLEYLLKFKGIGISTASVILTFYDPKNYGVFDIHVWRELFGKEPKNFSKIDNYLKLLGNLRERSKRYGLDVRKIEKALFQKNFEESK